MDPSGISPDADAATPTAPEQLRAFLVAYQQYRAALKKAGKDYTDTLLELNSLEPALTRAMQLQLDLLAAVAASRDPEAAYAIVAAVGTGLAPESVALLEEYRSFLAEALAKLTADPAFVAARTQSELRSAATRQRSVPGYPTPVKEDQAPTVKERVIQRDQLRKRLIDPERSRSSGDRKSRQLQPPSTENEMYNFFVAVDQATDTPLTVPYPSGQQTKQARYGHEPSTEAPGEEGPPQDLRRSF